jgi:hypothetical protein
MRQNQIVALALASAVSVQASPLIAASPGEAGQSQGTASVAGTSLDDNGATVAHVKVQLRDLSTGKLAAATTSDDTGQFRFRDLGAGTYAVELVNDAGQFIGTSASITVAAGATLTGVTVTELAAAQAALLAGAASGGGLSTALIITAVAAGAGIAALVVVQHNNASPSQ